MIHNRHSSKTQIYTRPIPRLTFYKTKTRPQKRKHFMSVKFWEDGISIKGINIIPQKWFSKKNMYLYLWSPSGGGRKLRSSTYHWVYWSLGKSHIIVAQHFPPHWTLRTHFLRENTWGKCQTSLLAGSFKKVRWRDKKWEQTLRKNTGSGREEKW